MWYKNNTTFNLTTPCHIKKERFVKFLYLLSPKQSRDQAC